MAGDLHFAVPKTAKEQALIHYPLIPISDIVIKTIDIIMSSRKIESAGNCQLKALTERITTLNEAGRLFIRHHHIETERIYRGITLANVDHALKTGRVVRFRDADSSVIWQGRDADGRTLELNCTLRNEDSENTIIVNEAWAVIVGTAYDPAVNDETLKAEWLKSHPDYEDAGKRRGVQKKVSITRF